MGHGTYCFAARSTRAKDMGYDTKSAREIFTQRSVNNAMDPAMIDMRECRDSDDHPASLAIVLALDVTGSMGTIPHHLVKDGLPELMDGIIQKGVADPAVLFVGIGDHECDSAPLQVGQFESSDELLDKWLTDLFIEGGGGGNNGESYMLAWFFAGRYTSIDCLEKRGKKGLLFTIGDEPVLPELPARAQKGIKGDGQYENATAAELLDKAREKYDVYHLHLKQGSNGKREDVIDGWKQLMGKDGLVIVENYHDIPSIIADIVSSREGSSAPVSAQGSNEVSEEAGKPSEEAEEMML